MDANERELGFVGFPCHLFNRPSTNIRVHSRPFAVKEDMRKHLEVWRLARAHNARMCRGTRTPLGYLRAWYGTRLRQRAPWLLPEAIEIEVRSPGAPLRLPVRLTTISDCIVMRGVFAEEEYAVPLDPQGVRRIVDLGANCGYATAWLSRHFPSATIASVEPDPSNLPWLMETIARNGLSAEVIAGAAGATPGLRRLSLNRGFPSRTRLGAPGGDGLLVGCHTIDDILGAMKWENADILKMDIEGAEAEIIRASGESLRRFRAITLELHPYVDGAEALRTLERLGFHTRRIPSASEPVHLALRRA